MDIERRWLPLRWKVMPAEPGSPPRKCVRFDRAAAVLASLVIVRDQPDGRRLSLLEYLDTGEGPGAKKVCVRVPLHRVDCRSDGLTLDQYFNIR
jgi:hypothetical protein